ncbi:nucleotide exchange factor GrpE [Pseudofrankia sp. BMG5.37]|uniref:nucleotide exchange factor GrpE n=1 Tax=Pseudofrankia sp. BMG5.37 TaxID=3050035 RepID=UPI0009F3FD35|nr:MULTISPECIES: nucleotide exchange factor GrpE [unclassified Pseudofrankia]MDT3445356.1 nucleotide exchange factor GrpE [Pseudofrankia sp. BMG5.37]
MMTTEQGRGEDPGRFQEEPAAAEPAELARRWRQAAADLDNLRKRFSRDLDRERDAARDGAAAAWLPVVDHLDLALTHADADPRSVVAGVRAIRNEALGVLDRLGYRRHEEVGMPFDPARHSAVALVDQPDVPPGTVVAVVRPGYGDAERQLRPVAVAVAQQPPKATAAEDAAPDGGRDRARPPRPAGGQPGQAGGRGAARPAE